MASSSPPPTDIMAAEARKIKAASLKSTVADVDKLIALLKSTRDQVANSEGPDGLATTKMLNPIKSQFEGMNSVLKDVSKAQKNFGKALDKNLPVRQLPNEYANLPDQPELVNRAIVMHLLREGQFPVAAQFLQEAKSQIASHNDSKLLAIEPGKLQSSFEEMYHILREIRQCNLEPAMQWAQKNHDALSAHQSTIEFDLVRLQFIWICQGPAINGLPDGPQNGLSGALLYGQTVFPRYSERHMTAIQQLSAAVIFHNNLAGSPYAHLFDVKAAFEDVTLTFTREFCSLLGLSPESPLYMAVSAGAMSLPQVLKFSRIQTQKVGWTTMSEMPFETPLPPSMIFHPIFVCPVLKEQTTIKNPPILLPCGHVISEAAFSRISLRQDTFKCPYCPAHCYVPEACLVRF
ncbi:hypothetical protein TD95_001264 [Thielaviopsis punctulata]|uniref:GID complex catalytic subunit 2 n=1 Tax=Thielaviopsis punctulata TaxID=72032 RepID=A0A0F4ZCB3_9PEZI|nr:hypothetical protein TD95_001264 [Thielaviopsis punctulata]